MGLGPTGTNTGGSASRRHLSLVPSFPPVHHDAELKFVAGEGHETSQAASPFLQPLGPPRSPVSPMSSSSSEHFSPLFEPPARPPVLLPPVGSPQEVKQHCDSVIQNQRIKLILKCVAPVLIFLGLCASPALLMVPAVATFMATPAVFWLLFSCAVVAGGATLFLPIMWIFVFSRDVRAIRSCMDEDGSLRDFEPQSEIPRVIVVGGTVPIQPIAVQMAIESLLPAPSENIQPEPLYTHGGRVLTRLRILLRHPQHAAGLTSAFAMLKVRGRADDPAVQRHFLVDSSDAMEFALKYLEKYNSASALMKFWLRFSI